MAIILEWFGSVCKVVIDRPEKRNAVDLATLLDLRQAQESASRGGARVLLLTGTPPAFAVAQILAGLSLENLLRPYWQFCTASDDWIVSPWRPLMDLLSVRVRNLLRPATCGWPRA